MGGASSVFKTFYERLVRRRKRDRWVRDDKTKLIPKEAKSKVSSSHQVLPKRIDDQMYDQAQQQALTRRMAEKPELVMHEDIHRRQLVALQCPSSSSNRDERSSSLAESFDSMASYIREGTDKIGVNFDSMESTDKKKIALLKTYRQMDKDERRAKSDKVKGGCEDEETDTTSDDEEADCQATNDEVVPDGEQIRSGVQTGYNLERFQVEIHVCDTPAGWWWTDDGFVSTLS